MTSVNLRSVTALVLIALPVFAIACGSERQQDGAQPFADNCARCHVAMAEGTNIGPLSYIGYTSPGIMRILPSRAPLRTEL